MNGSGHDAMALIAEHAKNFSPPPDALYHLAYSQRKDRIRDEAQQHYSEALKARLAVHAAAFSLLALEFEPVLSGKRLSLYDRLAQ